MKNNSDYKISKKTPLVIFVSSLLASTKNLIFLSFFMMPIFRTFWQGYIFLIVVAIIFFLSMTIAGYFVYKSLKFSFDNKEIIVSHKVISTSKKVISYDKLQNITIGQSFLERIFKIGTISFYTAGNPESVSPEASIYCLQIDDLLSLKDLVLEKSLVGHETHIGTELDEEIGVASDYFYFTALKGFISFLIINYFLQSLILIAFEGSYIYNYLFLVFSFVILIYSFVINYFRVKFYKCKLGPRVFEKNFGVIAKYRIYIPYHQIQNINTNQTWLQSAFSLSSVGFETASGTVGALPGLLKDEAMRIEEEVSKRIKSVKFNLDESEIVNVPEPIEDTNYRDLNYKAIWNFFWKDLPFIIIIMILAFVIIFFEIELYFFDVNRSPIIFGVVVSSFLLLSYYLAKLRFKNFKYSFKQSYIDEMSGIFVKNHTIIPYEQIEKINVHQNFIQRVMKIYSVKIQTAGNSGTMRPEGLLPGLSIEEVENVKKEISLRQENRKELLLSYISQKRKEGKSETEIKNRLFSNGWTPESLKNVLYDNNESVIKDGSVLGLDSKTLWKFFINKSLIFLISTFIIVLGIILDGDGHLITVNRVALFVLLGLSILFVISLAQVSVYKYFVENKHFIKSLGIFTKKNSTIPYEKVRNIYINQGVLDRIFNIYTIKLETAGNSWELKSEGYLLGVSKEDAYRLLETLIYKQNNKGYEEDKSKEIVVRQDYQIIYKEFKNVSKGYIYYETFNAFFIFLFIANVLFMIPLLIYYKYATEAQKNYKYMISKDALIIEMGVFNKERTEIPYEKIENIDIVQNLRERFFRIHRVEVQTAGSRKQKGSKRLPEGLIAALDKEEAEQLKKDLLEMSNLKK